MTVLNKGGKRSRMVVFRLSPDEYHSLRSTCLAANCRSISDYMRAELLDPARSQPPGSTVQSRFHEIDQRLGELLSLIQDISGRIASLDPQIFRADSSAGAR
jgi:hypothetical protein